MSAVKKTAKATLYIFGFFVLLLVGGGIYLYVNLNSLAQQLAESVASDAMGVPVRIGAMDISLEEKRIIVRNIAISNPAGYVNAHAVSIDKIEIAADTLSKAMLNFSLVGVDGTKVYLEVSQKGTNLGDLKKNIDRLQKGGTEKAQPASPIKVIVQKFSMTGARMKPSVTLIKRDLAEIGIPDITLTGIGEKQNGIVAQEAIGQIMSAVLKQFNETAGREGMLKGLSVDALKDIGLEGFRGAVDERLGGSIDELKGGVEGLKGLFKK